MYAQCQNQQHILIVRYANSKAFFVVLLIIGARTMG
jgi:hypothetical protein